MRAERFDGFVSGEVFYQCGGTGSMRTVAVGRTATRWVNN